MNTGSERRSVKIAVAMPTGRVRLATIVLIGSLALLSCEKRPTPEEQAGAVGSIANPSPSAVLAKVDVPPEGKKFDPPVRAEQLPAGAWYCDMGTVHWAQMNEGNHTCPICKMDLKHKN